MFKVGDRVKYNPRSDDDYVYRGLSREVIFTVTEVDPSDEEIYLKGFTGPWQKFWWRDFKRV